MAARAFDNNKPHSGRRVAGLLYMSRINALVAIKTQCHLAKSIFSNLGEEAHSRSEPRASHCLIGPFAAIIHTIAGSQERLAAAGQAVDLHSQAGGVAADVVVVDVVVLQHGLAA